MTTRPELIDFDGSHIPGLAALGLFVVMALVFVTAQFGQPAGFPDGSIVGNIGSALIGVQDVVPSEGNIPTEGFLVAFILIAIALDAALDGALMLAKREGGDE
jgi:NADH-quinone oxidoreductase subunit J